jgi:hypothetical protein
MKTEKELDDLKANWRHDPCWDIDETEGFEAHTEELKAYKAEMTQQWDNERKQIIKDKARRLKCSVELAEYIQVLETEMTKLIYPTNNGAKRC